MRLDRKRITAVSVLEELVKDEHIFVEKASGVRHDRPELDKALAALEAGDTVDLLPNCFEFYRAL